jgi:uncharacterized protein YbjT (DUF2867 family)
MILVNAANGQQGKLLAPKLISAGQAVRACVRSERSAAELLTAGATDVVVGDLADPDLIARAVSGVEKVYHVCPGIHPREREIGFAWIDAAKAAGVRHFVFSSVLHPLITELVQHEIKRDIEEHLIGSGLEFTILQPTIYMAPRRFGPAIHAGVLKAGWSLDREQSLVDIGDVTDVAAEVLMNSPHHATATYQLVGTGRYTAHDMGAAMAKVIGRDVKVEQVDSTTYFKGLFGDRDPRTIPHEISVSKSLTQRYSSHDFVGNPNVLTWLLGRAPTTFEQFVAAQAAELNRNTAGQ